MIFIRIAPLPFELGLLAFKIRISPWFVAPGGVFPWSGGEWVACKDNIIHGIGADATVSIVGQPEGENADTSY